MSEKVNLTRARLVEFDWTYNGAPVSLLVSRRQSSNAFKPLGVNGEPPTEDWGTWSTRDITRTGSNIRILAEFPLTLADLLPEGCARFMWRDRHMDVCYAERNSDGQWSASTDYGVTYSLDDLDALVNHATVVPLVVHPQYVEERR